MAYRIVPLPMTLSELHSYYSAREPQPKRNVYWSRPSVYLCVCPSPHSHTATRTRMQLGEWQGVPSSCALLGEICNRCTGFVAMTTLRRTRNACTRSVPCFYSAPQCSHCKRCTSYSNSVCLPVCLSVCHMPVLCKNDGT